VSIELNHTIAHATDRMRSAQVLAGILGVQAPPRWGPFTPVVVDGTEPTPAARTVPHVGHRRDRTTTTRSAELTLGVRTVPTQCRADRARTRCSAVDEARTATEGNERQTRIGAT
jgi:hypothetical protein